MPLNAIEYLHCVQYCEIVQFLVAFELLLIMDYSIV